MDSEQQALLKLKEGFKSASDALSEEYTEYWENEVE